jgi:hypothetical protein
MRFPVPLALAACALLAACRHDVSRFAQDGVRDADVGDAAVQGDAGHVDTAQPDAGQPFPYRWQENNPGAGHEEGTVTFALGCTRDGKSVQGCVLRCAFDDADLGGCFAQRSVYAQPGDHHFCVIVRPPASDDVYQGHELKQCVPFTTKLYSHPFMWQPVVPASDSTALSVQLACAQEPAPEGESVIRSDCQFRCSLDHIPYAECSGTFAAANLKPGKHELRVETCGPLGHEAEAVCRARVVQFEIADDAMPPAQSTPLVLPDVLAREQLGALAVLIDPYLAYAALCGPSDVPALDHEARFREYLSFALSKRPMPGEEGIAGCQSSLEERPADCWLLPGLSDRYFDDIMLRARLPPLCRSLFGGSGAAATACLTHAECTGVCERASSWFDASPTYGYCADEGPTEEGIMCASRGCQSGLYCYKSACTPVGTLGTPCRFEARGVDCADALTCGGSPRTCIPASAKLGEYCAFPRDCVEGTCVNSKCTRSP